MCSPEEVRPILQVEPGMTAPWLSVVARGQPDEDVAISREQRGVKAWMQADVTGQGVLPARDGIGPRVSRGREPGHIVPLFFTIDLLFRFATPNRVRKMRRGLCFDLSVSGQRQEATLPS